MRRLPGQRVACFGKAPFQACGTLAKANVLRGAFAVRPHVRRIWAKRQSRGGGWGGNAKAARLRTAAFIFWRRAADFRLRCASFLACACGLPPSARLPAAPPPFFSFLFARGMLSCGKAHGSCGAPAACRRLPFPAGASLRGFHVDLAGSSQNSCGALRQPSRSLAATLRRAFENLARMRHASHFLWRSHGLVLLRNRPDGTSAGGGH